ncbi:hypothetical protein V8G54_035486, partial [Vigna mungo]
NTKGQPLNVKRSFLTPLCKYWVALLYANISPCSHVSDLVPSRVVLLYYILQGRQISLVAGVDTLEAPLERPCKTIDRAYYIQYYLIDKEGLPIPAPQLPRPHRRHRPAQPAQPQPDQPDSFSMFEMRQMIQRLDAKMEAVNRIVLAQAEMLRHAFAASHLDFMTLVEYAARVAWPGDQAHSSEGGGTSSAT